MARNCQASKYREHYSGTAIYREMFSLIITFCYWCGIVLFVRGVGRVFPSLKFPPGSNFLIFALIWLGMALSFYLLDATVLDPLFLGSVTVLIFGFSFWLISFVLEVLAKQI